MPATHYEVFKVRNYECDAYGHLRGATYLRWMQESAFAASAAVGYDFSRYHNIGQIWLIHETAVEYLAPLHYGDEVEVKTWVMDIRRFRSRRAYEIRHRATGEVAARASTDWVYLDAETLRPQMIPEAIQLAFFPEGVPPETSPRERHPVAHDRPPEAIVTSQDRRVVRHRYDVAREQREVPGVRRGCRDARVRPERLADGTHAGRGPAHPSHGSIA